MSTTVDTRRVLIFLAFAYGIAWAFGLVVDLTGGMHNSPVILAIPSTQGGLTLAVLLIATGYMMAPALAHVMTRAITREGWRGTFLRPRLKRGWPFWLAGWFLPALLTIGGMLIYFALFPHTYDPALTTIRQQLDQTAAMTGQRLPFTPWMVVIINTSIGILLAPLVNGLFTFGEEFGWRGYLLPKLMPLGGRKAMLLIGVIWGVWHWPVIAMGHNYGLYTLNYPGAPWTGMLAMVWFTLVGGTFLGWIALRGGSVWPAVIGHAAMNGIGGLSLLFTRGEPLLLLGPTMAGVIGSAGFALAAIILFLSPGALAAPVEQTGEAPGAEGSQT